MAKVYTIEWSDCECHEVLAQFFTEAARDATFERIEAIPWHTKPGYIGYPDWEERTVALGLDRAWGNTWVRDKPIHGTIWTGEYEVYDDPISVFDKTDREPEIER